MTPETLRALRLNPKLRKKLRERQTELLEAVESGHPEAIQSAARAWADAERDAVRDIEAKTANPPLHRVSFLIEESYHHDFCDTAAEYKMMPADVAKRYCVSGWMFSRMFGHAARRGMSFQNFLRQSDAPTLARLALPNFSAR